MNDHFRNTWETYAASWKAESADEKRALFAKCLDANCEYNDPLTHTKGWDALLAYMLEFHKQIPGGHFVTRYFLAHHNQSIAKWEMQNAANAVLGEGASYGRYNDHGKLIAMTGFFDAPSP
jgi:hypothetical protein